MSRRIAFHPVTPDRWDDLEDLFGVRGACGGCWCMWYRLPRGEYEAGKGATNRRRLRRLVDQDPPGIIAYEGEVPVAWCSVAPRAEYRRLATSRVMKPPDDLPVWAIICLFVRQSHRGRGLSVRLIREAARFAAARGAPAVEAYPVIPGKAEIPPVFASQGILSAYVEAGFEVVARPSPTRAIVRRLTRKRRT